MNELSCAFLFLISCFLLVAVILYAFFFAFNLKLLSKSLWGTLGLVLALKGYIKETLIVLCVFFWVRNYFPFWFFFSFFILAGFLFVYAIQFLSIYYTKNIISEVALDNVKYVRNIIEPFSVCILIFPLFVAALFLVEAKSHSFSFSLSFSLIILVALIILSIPTKFQSEKLVKAQIWISQQMGVLQNEKPFYAMLRTLVIYIKKRRASKLIEFSEAKAEIVRKYGIGVNLNSESPFKKETIFSKQLEFPKLSSTQNSINLPNVIVIFGESMAAEKISVYNNKYPDLTPSISDFAAKSMVVRDYVNHTAATFRGIQGQLGSIFPKEGNVRRIISDLSKNPMNSLVHILKQKGYNTSFCIPHEEAEFLTYLSLLGFDETRSRDTIRSILPKDEKIGSYLTDRQMFKALNMYLILF